MKLYFCLVINILGIPHITIATQKVNYWIQNFINSLLRRWLEQNHLGDAKWKKKNQKTESNLKGRCLQLPAVGKPGTRKHLWESLVVKRSGQLKIWSHAAINLNKYHFTFTSHTPLVAAVTSTSRGSCPLSMDCIAQIIWERRQSAGACCYLRSVERRSRSPTQWKHERQHHFRFLWRVISASL